LEELNVGEIGAERKRVIQKLQGELRTLMGLADTTGRWPREILVQRRDGDFSAD
jgi:hypothetical protein